VDPSIASEHLGWCNAVNLVERSLAIVHGVSVGEESDVQNLPSADALRPAPAAISPTTVRDDDITSERAAWSRASFGRHLCDPPRWRRATRRGHRTERPVSKYNLRAAHDKI
jgi:hypothetical protein